MLRVLSLVVLLMLDDVPRFLQCLRTLEAFFPFDHVRELVVLSPDQNAYDEILAARLVESNYTVRYLADSAVLGALNGRPRRINYMVQQGLKLLVARHISTPFYLLFDSDVLMLQRLQNWSSVFPSQLRAAYVPEPSSSHPNLWKCSCLLLGFNETCGTEYRFGATPAILSTKIALSALQLIEATHHTAAEVRLLDNSMPSCPYMKPDFPWSEFTIYAISGYAHGDFFDHHSLADRPAFYGGIWSSSQLRSCCLNGSDATCTVDPMLLLKLAREHCGDSVFCVVQSTAQKEIGVPVSAWKGLVDAILTNVT